MILMLLILFGCALIGGLAAMWYGYKSSSIQLPLIFGGAFLFSITIVHLLPELFSLSDQPMRIGLFILLGFFLQQILEIFTSGIEHGHFHKEDKSIRSRISLVLALLIHSLMEGTLLSHESPLHSEESSYPLLFGIILHKAPAAYALTAMFKDHRTLNPTQISILLLFSVASPLGFLFTKYATLSENVHLILFSLVAGAFLHISTTIFVESRPDHHFKWNRLLVGILGALVAIVAEYFI